MENYDLLSALNISVERVKKISLNLKFFFYFKSIATMKTLILPSLPFPLVLFPFFLPPFCPFLFSFLNCQTPNKQPTKINFTKSLFLLVYSYDYKYLSAMNSFAHMRNISIPMI